MPRKIGLDDPYTNGSLECSKMPRLWGNRIQPGRAWNFGRTEMIHWKISRVDMISKKRLPIHFSHALKKPPPELN